MSEFGKKILDVDGECLYYKNFLQNRDLLPSIIAGITWEQHTIKLFGKEHLQPRKIAWMADPNINYSYSKTTLKRQAWTPKVKLIKERVEDYTDTQFNGVLLNYYENGNHSMGWHADNEPELGEKPMIASISLGATRKFKLKHRTKDLKVDCDLESGSLLIMKGETQKYWLHALPKTKKVNSPRLNLTFRFIKEL